MASAWGLSWGTPSAWGDSWGIGLAVEAGIGLLAAPARAPNVDFVYSSIGRLHDFPQNRNMIRMRQHVIVDVPLAPRAPRQASGQETAELKEMMELYASWKKAA